MEPRPTTICVWNVPAAAEHGEPVATQHASAAMVPAATEHGQPGLCPGCHNHPSLILPWELLPEKVAESIEHFWNQLNSMYSKGILDDALYNKLYEHCLLYTSPSPRDRTRSRMPSSA